MSDSCSIRPFAVAGGGGRVLEYKFVLFGRF
jgi:hypothetical protein